MAIRMTAFFNGPSNTAGWTETLYDNPGSMTTTLTKADTVWRPARVAILSTLCSLRQIRVSDEAVLRDSFIKSYTASTGAGQVDLPTGASGGGRGDYAVGAPQAGLSANALLLRLEASALYRRMFLMRGVGEGFFGGDGIYNPNPWMASYLAAFKTVMVGTAGWALKRQIAGTALIPNALAVAAGNYGFTLTFNGANVPAGVAVNALIQLSSWIGTGNLNGRWRVASVSNSTPDGTHSQATVYPKKRQITGTPGGGFVRVITNDYANFTDVIPLRGVIKKTGRPFGLPRGRARVRTG